MTAPPQAEVVRRRARKGRARPVPAPIGVDVLATTLDHISDGVLLVDSSGTIRYANRPLGELFGHDPAALVGRPIEILIPGDLRSRHRRLRSATTGPPIPRAMGRADLDIEGLHADGRRIPVDVQLAPLPDTGLVAATVRDMTGARRLAAERAIERLDLRAAAARIERLIASHDVVVQELFALGAGIEAHAINETATETTRRLAEAVAAIDRLIDSTRVEALDTQ